MKNICVFCGSSKGNNLAHIRMTEKLGETMIEQELDLVFGGGSIGLMGVLANKILENGGKVIGVIPHFLVEKEVDHKGVTEMIKVESMHERKQTMADLADGFIALPGGFGTLEELLEMLTWSQLGLNQKPISILNSGGFFNPLLSMLDTMLDEGFLKKENRELLIVEQDPVQLIKKLVNYTPKHVEKWLDREQT